MEEFFFNFYDFILGLMRWFLVDVFRYSSSDPEETKKAMFLAFVVGLILVIIFISIFTLSFFKALFRSDKITDPEFEFFYLGKKEIFRVYISNGTSAMYAIVITLNLFTGCMVLITDDRVALLNYVGATFLFSLGVVLFSICNNYYISKKIKERLDTDLQ